MLATSSSCSTISSGSRTVTGLLGFFSSTLASSVLLPAFSSCEERQSQTYSFSKSEFTTSRGESTVVIIKVKTRRKIGTKEDFGFSSLPWDHREPTKTGYSWRYYDIKPFRYYDKFFSKQPFPSWPNPLFRSEDKCGAIDVKIVL